MTPLVASTPTPLPTVADAKAYALRVLGPRGYACLNSIVEHESHWRVHALNKSSGAFGIPQALPGSKMRSDGADWRDNAVTQTRWTISYVNWRYGGACAAAAFRDRNGWY